MPIQEDVWPRDAADELFDAIDPGRWGKRLLVLRWLYRQTADRQLVSESRVYAQASTHELAERWGIHGHGWPMRVLRELVDDEVLDRIEGGGRRPSAYAIEWRWWLWADRVPWLVPRETVRLRMESAVLRRAVLAPQALVVARRGDAFFAPQPPVVARSSRATKSRPSGASGAPERAATTAPYVSPYGVPLLHTEEEGGGDFVGHQDQPPPAADAEQLARDVMTTANQQRRAHGRAGYHLNGQPWRSLVELLARPGVRDVDVIVALAGSTLGAPEAVKALWNSLGGRSIDLQPPKPAAAPHPVVVDYRPPEPVQHDPAARAALAGVRAVLSPSTQATEVPA